MISKFMSLSCELKSGSLTLKKIFAKLKFSPALSEKILPFVYLEFKIENK